MEDEHRVDLSSEASNTSASNENAAHNGGPHIDATIVQDLGQRKKPNNAQRNTWCTCNMYCASGRQVHTSTFYRHQAMAQNYENLKQSFGLSMPLEEQYTMDDNHARKNSVLKVIKENKSELKPIRVAGNYHWQVEDMYTWAIKSLAAKRKWKKKTTVNKSSSNTTMILEEEEEYGNQAPHEIDEGERELEENTSFTKMAKDSRIPLHPGDAGGDHHEDFSNEYGPPLPTQEELREMEHRRLVGEATNLMLNFTKDPKLAKYMSVTAFHDVQVQWKATTTSPPKSDSKKQYSKKELEEEIDTRLARILGAQKQGKKHDRKRKKSTDFLGYLGNQSTFDKAKKHKKRAAVPSSSSSSSSSSSDSSLESSEEERRSKKRSKRYRHGKGKRKTRKSKSRRVDDSSTEDSSIDSLDSEDGHFYANKKNFYKANQYDFLEDKSKKVREFKEGGQSIKFKTFSGYKDASKALSFIQQFDIAFAGGRYSEQSKIRRAASYFKGNARTWWSTLLLNKTAPVKWLKFKKLFISSWLTQDFFIQEISFREQIERFTLGLPTEIRDHCLEQKSASIQELMSHAKRGFAIHSGSLTYPTDDGMTQREDQFARTDTRKREPYPEKRDARPKLTPQESSRLMREGKCFGCGEPGHISAKCPKKAPKEQKEKDEDRPESSRATEERGRRGKMKTGLVPGCVGTDPNTMDESTELCRAWGKVKDQEALIFFDGGAKANFISPEMAARLEITPNRMGPPVEAVLAAPGRDVAITPVIGKLRLHCQGYLGYEDFYIMPLEGCDVLLGIPWYLPLVEFAYNNTIHSSMGKAPFEIVEGAMKVPPFLSTKDKIFEANEYTRDLDTAFAKVRETLQKSQERQKKAADRHRRDLKLKENDWVL
ncbi:hypothetical protein L7F22_031020 [Adiantum nelumboides]|nr:hypothetical protein [Adiantum nelumboides]